MHRPTLPRTQWRGPQHPSFILHPVFLLLPLILCLSLSPLSAAGQAPTSSSSFLEWQFCHFARGEDGGWNVTTTGFFVTTPMYTDPSRSTQVAYYTVLSITGTRIQSYYGHTSSALITGLIPPGGWAGNDNVLQTYFPVLSNQGLSYRLDRNVTQIGDPTLYSEINLYMQERSSPLENGIDASIVGLAYFVYSKGNSEQPLQCPPPPPQVYRFLYYAAPTTFDDGLSSSCATGTFSLLGPYSFIDFVTLRAYEEYIVSDSTGSRVFVNASGVQWVNFTGVTESDGSDFTYYSTFPYADEAGITLSTSSTPLLQNSPAANTAATQWLSISSQDHVTMVEQAYQGDSLQMEITVAPLTSSPSTFTCTEEVHAIKWDFCFISTGSDAAGRWVVIMNGSLLTTNNLNLTHPSYLVSASQGQRTQVLPDGTVQLTPISGVQPLNGFASQPNDNRLYPSHPTLSEAGLTLQFAYGYTVVTLPYDYATGLRRIPPVWFSTIHGSPAAERYVDQGLVDWSTFVYQRADDQWNLTLPSTLPCALPAQYAAELNTAQLANLSQSTQSLLTTPPTTVSLPFYYSATPAPQSDQDSSFGTSWSACATGTFQAVGPTTYGAEMVWQVLSVSGQRLFLDQRGVSSVSTFTSVSTAAGANQLLYATPPFVDEAGLSLVLSPFPLFANAPENVWFDFVRMANGSGETTGTYTPTSAVTFLFSTDPSTTYTCAQPNDHLESSQEGGVMVLAVVVLLFGTFTAISTIEQIYVSFRRRRPFALLAWLGLSTLAIAVPVWAGILTYYASLTVHCPRCLSPLTISYSLDDLLLASIPAVVCVFLSVCTMLRSLKDYEIRRVRVLRQRQLRVTEGQSGSTVEPSRDLSAKSGASSTGKAEVEGSISGFYSHTSPSTLSPIPQGEQRSRFSIDRFLDQQRTKAASTIGRLKDSYPRYIPLAAVALTAALVLTRWTLTYVVVDQALMKSSPVVDVFSSLLVYALCYVALLFYFYSPHFRWLSSITLTAAVLLDCELHFASDVTLYTPDERWRATSPSAGGNGLSRTQVSYLAVISIAAVVGGICLMALVYMVIYRTRMSRRHLAATIKKTTTKLNSAQSVIQGQKARIHKLEVVGVEALKSMDAIALLRPAAQMPANRGVEDHRHIARTMLWTYLGNSSSSSLYRCALQRSAALVAPVLFTQRSSATAAPSASRAFSPSSTGGGSVVINMKGVRASVAGQGLVMGRTVSLVEETGNSKKNSLTFAADEGVSTLTPTINTASLPSTPLPMISLTPKNGVNGVEALLKTMQPQHRSSGAELAAAEEAAEPTMASLDPTVTAELQRLGAHLLVNEQREEELLHQSMAALQRPSVDVHALSNPIQLIPEEGRSREVTALLARLTTSTASYRPTLLHILSHPVCAELLKDHMQAAASVENVLFLLAVDKWRLCRSHALRHLLAVLIFDEFIAEEAVHQINIEATQRAGLAVSIAGGKGGRAKLSDALFSRVEKEVCMLVDTNNWKSFVRSPLYELCATVLVRNAVVLTATQLDGGKEELDETAILSTLQVEGEGEATSEEEEEEEDAALPGQLKARGIKLGRKHSVDTHSGMVEHSVSGASSLQPTAEMERDKSVILPNAVVTAVATANAEGSGG